MVLQALARNPRLTLDVVKGYVTRQLGGEAAATRADLEEAEALRAEAERTRAQVDHLRTEVRRLGGVDLCWVNSAARAE